MQAERQDIRDLGGLPDQLEEAAEEDQRTLDRLRFPQVKANPEQINRAQPLLFCLSR
ncbi:hypothetical protein GCM10027098_10690 [Bowmanella dokdonensis]